MISRVATRRHGMHEDTLKLIRSLVVSRVTYSLPYQRLAKSEQGQVDAMLRKAYKAELKLPPGHDLLLRLGYISQFHDAARRKLIPDQLRATYKVAPIPRNMDPRLHQGRREARVEALERTYAHKHTTYYVDAANYDHANNKAVATVVDHTLTEHAAASDSGHADQACQTEQAVCSFLEVQALKAQLSSMRQRLERCQKQLAKMRVLANKNARLLRNLDKLSTREKLIYDQCIMKANAKSPKAARYKKAWIYDCLLLKIKSTAVYTFLHENEYLPLPNPRTLYTYLRSLKADFGFDSSLFTVLKDKLQVLPERERRGVLMFDEMSVRKSVHIRESDMALLGKVNFAEHTRPSDWINSDQKQLQTSFQHPCDPSRTVQALIDPPHVFKCIRNNLQKVGKFLLPEGHEVHHFHYSALLEYEEQQAGLRAVPKLTRAHIFPNAFQKMSVPACCSGE
ncbi:hypothetical protein MRX96_035545 [Rhipicephalus microplus]